MSGAAAPSSPAPSSLARWSWLLVLAAVLAAYAWHTRKHDLAAAIRRDFVASGGKVIDLSKSVPFGWTRVCVVGPYADAKATSALLGFDWNSDPHSAIRSSDTTVLLVFAHKNIVLGAADYSRELAPWAGAPQPGSGFSCKLRCRAT